MICGNCGSSLFEGDIFCANCGAAVRNQFVSGVKEELAPSAEQTPYSGTQDVVEAVPRNIKTVALIGGLAVVVAALAVIGIVASTSGTSTETIASSAIPTTTVDSNNVSGSTTATFPPSTTVPTSGLILMNLTLYECSTTLGVPGEAAANLTTPVRVMVPPGYSSNQLAVYTDSQGMMELLAPANWDCEATVGADGSSSISIYPPTQGDVSVSALNSDSTTEEVTGSQTSASSFGAASQACQLFVAAYKALEGTPCTMRSPSQEEATLYTPNIIEFNDPPGIAGDANPSGGAYAASGVMTYYSGNNNGSWTETCLLAPSESSLCAAILSSFIASYGTN